MSSAEHMQAQRALSAGLFYFYFYFCYGIIIVSRVLGLLGLLLELLLLFLLLFLLLVCIALLLYY